MKKNPADSSSTASDEVSQALSLGWQLSTAGAPPSETGEHVEAAGLVFEAAALLERVRACALRDAENDLTDSTREWLRALAALTSARTALQRVAGAL